MEQTHQLAEAARSCDTPQHVQLRNARTLLAILFACYLRGHVQRKPHPGDKPTMFVRIGQTDWLQRTSAKNIQTRATIGDVQAFGESSHINPTSVYLNLIYYFLLLSKYWPHEVTFFTTCIFIYLFICVCVDFPATGNDAKGQQICPFPAVINKTKVPVPAYDGGCCPGDKQRCLSVVITGHRGYSTGFMRGLLGRA